MDRRFLLTSQPLDGVEHPTRKVLHEDTHYIFEMIYKL